MRTVFLFVLLLGWYHFGIGQQATRAKLTIAHRGGTELFPENTVPAFQHATELGIDAVEFDVWLTADSQSVVIHDDTYDRTTNVEEVFGPNTKIGQLTLAQAKTLYIDGGSGWDNDYAHTIRVPTLKEVLESVKSSDLIILVDIKGNVRKIHENLLSILNEIGLDPKRIVTCNFAVENYSVPPMRTLYYVDKPFDPNLHLVHTQEGLLFDGKHLIMCADSILKKSEFQLTLGISKIDSLQLTQYLYELTDYNNPDDWIYALRFDPPNTLQVFLKAESGSYGTFVGSFNPLQNSVVTLTRSKDSLIVKVNGKAVIEQRIAFRAKYSSNVLLCVGSDRYGNRRFYGSMKTFEYQSASDTLILVDLTKSLENTIASDHNLIENDFLLWGTDILGLSDATCSTTQAEKFKKLGYDLYLWTINDVNRFTYFASQSYVDGILTDSPGRMKSVLYRLAQIGSGQSIRFYLGQNYPNPFNPTTVISFQLSAPSFVTLKVFDVLGREVATLVNESKPEGTYNVRWDASAHPSGVYFYRLAAGDFIESKKMILMK